MLIPARLVLPGVGGIGTPANVVALGLLLWWVASLFVPSLGLPRAAQPVRYGVFLYLWCILLSYALSYLRPLTDLEASGADRAVIIIMALVGVALIAADGIETQARLEVLLRRLVWLAVLVAGIGVVQFVLRFDVVPLLRPPGLVENIDLQATKERSIFVRPFSTTLHPIEFSVVLAMVFPLALHFAMVGARGWTTVLRWGAVVLLVVSIMMAVSRSGVLGLALGVLVLAMTWSTRRRVNAVVAALVILGLIRAAVPGLVGTLRNLFLNAGNDPSIQGRLDDVAEVRRLIQESPVYGRGIGTFNSLEYFILDNEYYRSLLEVGILGVTALLTMIGVAAFAARRIARESPDQNTAHLSQALLASLVVAAVSLATFDGLAYPMYRSILFLLVGTVGALWRLHSLRRTSSQALPAGGHDATMWDEAAAPQR
jgi:hypothetical protein